MNTSSDHLLHLSLVCTVTIVFLILCTSNLLAFQQSGNGTQPTLSQQSSSQIELDHVIGTLSSWATILFVFVTVVVALSAFNVLHQYYRAAKLGEEIRSDLMVRVEKEIIKIRDQYDLPTLKKPEEILELARREYEPLIHDLRAAIEREHVELTSTVNTSESECKVSTDYTMRALAELKADISKYQSPADLQEITLRKVLNAFLQLKNLSDVERQSISSALSADREIPSKTIGD